MVMKRTKKPEPPEKPKMRRLTGTGIFPSETPCRLCCYFWESNPIPGTYGERKCKKTGHIIDKNTLFCDEFVVASHHYCAVFNWFIGLTACMVRRRLTKNKYGFPIQECYRCGEAALINRVFNSQRKE